MNIDITQLGLASLVFLLVLAGSVMAIDCALFGSCQLGTRRGWRHWVKLLLVCTIYLANLQIFSFIGEPIEPFLSQALVECYAAIGGYSLEPRGYMDQCKEGCSLARWVCLGAL